MAHTFEFAVLKAIPDTRRGERVNVGIVVFKPDAIDVRIPEAAKVRAISAGEWASYMADAATRLGDAFVKGEPLGSFLERFSAFENVIRFSEVSQFVAGNDAEYEGIVKELLTSFVRRQRETTRKRTTRINTEIARTFRSARLLATPAEGLDRGKIERDYSIAIDEGLVADFVHKNGAFHVTATLDLRRASVDLGHAALKAVVLDKASHVFGQTRRYAVYAALAGADQFRPHINLLREYSDDAFNWLNPQEKAAYTRTVYASLQGHHGIFSN